MLGAEVGQRLALLAARQVRRVGDDERIAAAEHARGVEQPARGHHGLVRVVAVFSIPYSLPPIPFFPDERRVEQRLQRVEGGDAERELSAFAGVARRVDQTAEQRRLDEEVVQAAHAGAQGFGVGGVGRRERIPLFGRRRHGQPAAGHARRRHARPHAELAAVFARPAPRRQRQRERGDLDAAPVELEAVDVVAQHGVDGGGGAQPLVAHAQRHQPLERRHQEVPGAAARVEHGECAPPAGRRRRRDRLVEQEVDHVGFGEELGDGGQLGGADFVAGFVDGVFASGLPVLVHPAERVGGGEQRRRQAGEQRGQASGVLGGERQRQDRIVRVEDLRQHARGQIAGQLEGVARAALPLGGQLGAVLQRDRHAVVEQEAVFGQEAREEHAVPVLVGGFGRQCDDRLGVVVFVQRIAERAAVRAQAAAQRALFVGEMRPRPGRADGERLERLGGGGFGERPRGEHGVLQLGAVRLS